MNEPIRLIMVLTTVASSDDADRLAKALVDQCLAACVQVDGPVSSHYRWAGKLACETEYRLAIKSSTAAWPSLKDKLDQLHPYEEPQIVMFEIDDSSDGYRDWVIDQTT